MDGSENTTRLRGGWAIPAAFLAALAAATVVVGLEFIGLALMLGVDDPVAGLREVGDWLLPLTLGVMLTGVTIFGLPVWIAMHQLGVVHPGLGALVGGVAGVIAASVLSLLVLSGIWFGPFVLLGALPGAAGGAVCLWVAYEPKP